MVKMCVKHSHFKTCRDFTATSISGPPQVRCFCSNWASGDCRCTTATEAYESEMAILVSCTSVSLSSRDLFLLVFWFRNYSLSSGTWRIRLCWFQSKTSTCIWEFFYLIWETVLSHSANWPKGSCLHWLRRLLQAFENTSFQAICVIFLHFSPRTENWIYINTCGSLCSEWIQGGIKSDFEWILSALFLLLLFIIICGLSSQPQTLTS